MKCVVDGENTYNLTPGNFIAEAGLHAGAAIKTSVKTSGGVVSLRHSTIWRFRRDKLVEALDKNTTLKKSLQSVLSWDIISKLKCQRHNLTENKRSISDTLKWTATRNAQTDVRYKSLVSALLHNGRISTRDKKIVDKYRLIHVVDDTKHIQTLKELGWTALEYQRGRKEHEAVAA